MIRLLQRKLIIPRGDTGSFSIPTLGTVEENDIAIFGIFDVLTHETKLIKAIKATMPTLSFTLTHNDTANLEPKTYNWDIRIYRSPEYDEDGILINAAEVNSYYSAFKLPICEVKEVALDMNTERWRTRDLLLESDNTNTTINSISSIYPWENLQLSFLAGQLYALAKEGGYKGSTEEFNQKFGELLEEKTIEYVDRNNFPSEGSENKLYFDTNEKILYYWKDGYYPINATLIENTVLVGGEA